MIISFLIGWTSAGVPTIYGTETYLIEVPMTLFFAAKDYGSGCKEINYVTFCVDKDLAGDEFKDGGHYISRKKKIECSVELDYKTSMRFKYRGEFANYIKNRFLDKAVDFYDFGIPDFNLDQFVEDLELFFNEYLVNHKEKDLPLWPEGLDESLN